MVKPRYFIRSGVKACQSKWCKYYKCSIVCLYVFICNHGISMLINLNVKSIPSYYRLYFSQVILTIVGIKYNSLCFVLWSLFLVFCDDILCPCYIFMVARTLWTALVSYVAIPGVFEYKIKTNCVAFYSKVPNSRGSSNKRGGPKFL